METIVVMVLAVVMTIFSSRSRVRAIAWVVVGVLCTCNAFAQSPHDEFYKYKDVILARKTLYTDSFYYFNGSFPLRSNNPQVALKKAKLIALSYAYDQVVDLAAIEYGPLSASQEEAYREEISSRLSLKELQVVHSRVELNKAKVVIAIPGHFLTGYVSRHRISKMQSEQKEPNVTNMNQSDNEDNIFGDAKFNSRRQKRLSWGEQ